MATGIMVRISCELLRDKTSDPAILVIDDTGNNVISLLSGHLGGANYLTLKIANLINSNPVITTSTDSHGFIGIDDLARRLHWKILNPELILPYNTSILNGEKIQIFSADKLESDTTLEYLLSDPKIRKSYIISSKSSTKSFNHDDFIQGNHEKGDIIALNLALNYSGNTLNNQNKKEINYPALFLRPKKLVIGVGSRKGVSKQQVITSIKKTAEILNLPLNRFDLMATIDIKKDEKGILEASNELNIPLEIVSTNKIKEFPKDKIHSSSEFVEKTFGIKGVCEPAALLIAGSNSKLIFKKTSYDGVTIAVAESD
jgi:cobalt-precorrin 5A hydrolase